MLLFGVVIGTFSTKMIILISYIFYVAAMHLSAFKSGARTAGWLRLQAMTYAGNSPISLVWLLSCSLPVVLKWCLFSLLSVHLYGQLHSTFILMIYIQKVLTYNFLNILPLDLLGKHNYKCTV